MVHACGQTILSTRRVMCLVFHISNGELHVTNNKRWMFIVFDDKSIFIGKYGIYKKKKSVGIHYTFAVGVILPPSAENCFLVGWMMGIIVVCDPPKNYRI